MSLCRVYAFGIMLMQRVKYTHTAIIRTVLVLIALFGLWALGPKAETVAFEEPVEPEPIAQKEESVPAVPMATSVNLIVDTPTTETALSEMLNGRFLVDTEISSASQKQEVYRQLFLRGGIIISMDSTGDYYFLDPSGDRISLNELDASIVDLDHYALHRPRNVSPVDYTYLSRSIESGDEVFLVMPNHFESGIFASIEKVLPAPLDQFSNASITVGVSRNGHLDFTLHSVVGNDGTTIQSGHSIRGL
jgi:hypothetical protein